MTDLPEPLVPAECSMAGNDWFPLHFDRLRKSKWWRRASDVARARNVMLWGEAYKQVPAGSMPDDDDELAEAAGFGMDVEAFLAVKAEIMAPWTFCSDGRWYHPTVCEVVLDAWERAGERRKKEAAKKAAQRAKVRGQAPPRSPVPAEAEHVPGDAEIVPGDSAKKAGDFGTQDRQDRTGEDRSPQPPVGGASDQLFERTWRAYPDKGRATIAKDLGRKAFDDAVAAGHDPAEILRGAETLRDCDYIRSGGKPKRFDRWLAGKLFVADTAVTGDAPAGPWPGPAEIWDVAVGRMGEAWARRYLGASVFRDGALTIASPTLAKGLKAELGRDLDALGYRLIQEAAGRRAPEQSSASGVGA